MDSDSASSVYSGSQSSVEVKDLSPPFYQFKASMPVDEGEDAPDEANIKVSQRCSCGNCRLTPEENVCCRDIPQVKHKCGQVNVCCITNHPGFELVTLNPDVLQVSYCRYQDVYGKTLPDLNSRNRHLACINFIFMCWSDAGQQTRAVIPSCVAGRMRQKLPEGNENYNGLFPRPL
nr:Nanor [Danio rerio]CAM12237.1 Nanor [Danio rerio]